MPFIDDSAQAFLSLTVTRTHRAPLCYTDAPRHLFLMSAHDMDGVECTHAIVDGKALPIPCIVPAHSGGTTQPPEVILAAATHRGRTFHAVYCWCPPERLVRLPRWACVVEVTDGGWLARIFRGGVELANGTGITRARALKSAMHYARIELSQERAAKARELRNAQRQPKLPET